MWDDHRLPTKPLSSEEESQIPWCILHTYQYYNTGMCGEYTKKIPLSRGRNIPFSRNYEDMTAIDSPKEMILWNQQGALTKAYTMVYALHKRVRHHGGIYRVAKKRATTIPPITPSNCTSYTTRYCPARTWPS